MNDKPNKAKYYRLLEKGEIVKGADVMAGENDLLPCSLISPVECLKVFRPTVCDEWIEYSKQKPTKEDFEPTGKIDCHAYGDVVHEVDSLEGHSACLHWRRITPPQPAKPKEVDIMILAGRRITSAIPLPDGTVKLDCGDVISAESINEFFKVRKEVMGKEL